MIVSTSYRVEGFDELITAIIKIANPDLVVELGTQQGKSAIAIAKGLCEGQRLFTYDLFEDTYREPPYAPTKADLEQARININQAGEANRVTVTLMDAFEVHGLFSQVDVLHIDLCNYYDNVFKVLEQWYKKVKKLILIEGGVYNYWQRKYQFEPFISILEMDFIKNTYNYCVIRGSNDQAITILTKKGE